MQTFRPATWRPDSAFRQLHAARQRYYALTSAGVLASQGQQGSSCDPPLFIQNIKGSYGIGSACHLNCDSLCSQTSSQSIRESLNVLSTANHHNVCVKEDSDFQSG